MKRMLVIFCLFALSGCASMHSIYVNPKTGLAEECRSSGFGLLGVPLALGAQTNCEHELKQRGFVNVKDLDKQPKEVTTSMSPPETNPSPIVGQIK